MFPSLGRGGFGSFGTNAQELAVLGEPTVGSVEDEIHFVDAAGTERDGFGAEAFEMAEQGFGVSNGEFNFGFAGHAGSLRVQSSRFKGCAEQFKSSRFKS